MKEKNANQLTKGEMQVMNVLWSLPDEKGFSNEIMEKMPEPKPALTTLLTFLKILKEKGFVNSVKVGKSHLFSAIVSRRAYTSSYMRDVRDTFFGGSFASLVSFFAEEEKLSQEDIDEILAMLKK
ncbi:MAG: BlaI/MecI/CopY family transcriptional regulator [Prevotella sp.]|nr:BlaI/MecI/CopY family transcriptional regulator [Prevotella sp.]